LKEKVSPLISSFWFILFLAPINEILLENIKPSSEKILQNSKNNIIYLFLSEIQKNNEMSDN